MSAYNAESTIRRAIKSVLKQTLKEFELIIVNDCSTDNTEEVVHSYTDERIRCYSHPENKGAGEARKTGISYATGEYICFLDSDDYYKKDFLQIMYDNAVTSGSDIVSSGYIGVENGKRFYNRLNNKYQLKDFDKYTKTEVGNAYIFLQSSIVKRELFDKVTYSSRRYCEDTPTFIKLIFFANHRTCIDYCGYYYTQNSWSLIHSASAFKRDLFIALCAIDTIEFMRSQDKFMSPAVFIEKFKELVKSGCSEEDRKLYKEELSEVAKFFINNVNL